MKNIAAFFDIDGTLYRNSLMIEHFKKLLKYEVFDPIIWHSDIKQKFNEWDSREGDYDIYMEELANVYIDSLKGLNKNEYDFIAKQVINLCGDRVYSYTRDQIAYHQEKGHLILFISGSPDYLVEKMAEKYNATDFIATKYLTNDDNSFNGKVIPMWDNKHKTTAIESLRDKYNIDLDNSFAYGDTNGDISMLRIVGNPVTINPSFELINSIKNDDSLYEKVKIIIERKNVIYKLNEDIDITRGGR